jgi:CRISPR-associated endonuclease/helicase Cas3
MENERNNFEMAFAALTGSCPFPWQQALYERFIADRHDNVPASCNLPTGLGKTSVIAIWLIALASRPEKMPRRLVYVVNRRTVVDQTTIEAEKLKANATKAGVPEPAISTLRGQFADNREWSADPSRPAIICGTVDMIGSRLLFSGYGVGRNSKPLHAGFLGQDVLLVHDEAHLEPAFQTLIEAIEKEQTRCNEFGKFRVMELSATSRGDGDEFKLTPSDEQHAIVQQRIGANKKIHLHENQDERELADVVADLALKFKGSERAILIFVRKVDDVDRITKKLPKGSFEQLTGTLRGKERDELVEKSIFKRFLPNAKATEETVYLVCTSAGEVGVNISADHLVCDLSTFESMAQRFGRVNRFGDRCDTEIHIVFPTSFGKDGKIDKLEERRRKTLELLKQLNGDGSPRALGGLPADKRLAAFAPTPIILPTSDILFDAWALTTIREPLPGRPTVEPYLHGIADWQPPETHVAWREEVWELRLKFPTEEENERERESRKDLSKFAAELLEDYPLKPHELLRDNSSRVFDHLKKLKTKPATPVWIVSSDDIVEVATLGELIDGYKEDIQYKTILLPPIAGGLANGMLDSDSNMADDVADEWYMDKERNVRQRIRVWGDDEAFAEKTAGMRLVRRIDLKSPDNDEDAEGKSWFWYELAKNAADGKATASRPYGLQPHLDDAEKAATAIVAGLKLAEPLRTAIIVAAMYHDLGKNRTLWQRSIGNPDLSKPLAKSGGKMRPRELTGYRHEYGSLHDVTQRDEFKKLNAGMQELVLHLIAAHHGRARPHFTADEAFEPEPRERDRPDLAAEIPRRFAKLQRKYGRWGLAYLESLVRAADIRASQKAE